MAKTSAEIRASIGVFSTNRDALRDMAHGILMDILVHAAPVGSHVDAGASGDTSLAYAMLKELPKSWAEQARVWLDKFSPIRVIVQREKHGLADKYKALGDKSNADFIENKDERDAARLTWWKLAEAAETPFYKAVEEPDVKMYGMDFIDGFIDAKIKELQKKIDDKKIDPKFVPAANLQIERLKAAKALKIETAPAVDSTSSTKENDPAAQMAQAANG